MTNWRAEFELLLSLVYSFMCKYPREQYESICLSSHGLSSRVDWALPPWLATGQGEGNFEFPNLGI